jgi:hypothetical protein
MRRDINRVLVEVLMCSDLLDNGTGEKSSHIL